MVHLTNHVLWKSDSLTVLPWKDAQVLWAPLASVCLTDLLQGRFHAFEGIGRQTEHYLLSWVGLPESRCAPTESPLWASLCPLRELELWTQRPRTKSSFTADFQG